MIVRRQTQPKLVIMQNQQTNHNIVICMYWRWENQFTHSSQKSFTGLKFFRRSFLTHFQISKAFCTFVLLKLFFRSNIHVEFPALSNLHYPKMPLLLKDFCIALKEKQSNQQKFCGWYDLFWVTFMKRSKQAQNYWKAKKQLYCKSEK